MIYFQTLLQRLMETLGPVRIELRDYVKRKQVTFVNKRKSFLFHLELSFYINFFNKSLYMHAVPLLGRKKA